jgi:hypothetical protein
MWKLNGLHWFAIALIYIAFFGLIGVAIYLTKSASPLWALLLTPSFSSKNDTDETDAS